MTVYLVIFDRRAYQISGKLFADIAEYIDDHYVEAHTDLGAERLRRGSAASRNGRADVHAHGSPGAGQSAGASRCGLFETLLRLIDRRKKGL